MYSLLLIFHVMLALALVGLIMMQHGKGADAGAAFGSGSSGTVFGAAGTGSFMTRLTTVLAITFFATSLTLAVFTQDVTGRTGQQKGSDSVISEDQPVPSGQPTAGQTSPTPSPGAIIPKQPGETPAVQEQPVSPVDLIPEQPAGADAAGSDSSSNR
ncbi:MAG: hypothetical protein BMS9Abin15_1097 [Gammaproteobacteria bacterium]|nr:MAG: hypothetical protein BMS9Abin15_1097 [Gammaproteobacteria bacterium]